MKTNTVLIFFAILIFFSKMVFSQQALLSPKSKKFLNQIENNKDGLHKPGKEFVCKQISDKIYLSSMIKVNQDIKMADLNNLGVMIGTKAGNIWTAQVPAGKFADFTKVKGIDYIELDEPVYFEMDSARHEANVDSAHYGYTLPHPFSGKNVVVGIIDAGFDYSHPDFLDTSGTHYRVKKVWEQKSTGTPPAGYTYGNEITDSTGLYTTGTDADLISHGSHVAGIAAGSGIGSNNGQFRGVAFESDLVFVGIRPDPNQWTSTGMSNIIDGMNYIFQYAASVGKPAVVNLSWGCTIGSHDGTSLFSQACDQLTGNGKIFVCSAGNNGNNNIHATKTFSETDTITSTMVNFSSSLTEKRTWVDIWGEEGQQLCTGISLFSALTPVVTSEYYCASDTVTNFVVLSPTGDTCYVTLTNSASEQNGKPRCFYEIYSKTTLKVCINVTSKSGTIHFWTGFVQDYYGYYGSFANTYQPGGVTGNSYYTLGDMASTKSAIAVAAYTSKNVFTNIDGGTINYSSYAQKGKIAPFSSKGNTVDNRIKPDIAAPGLLLGSAVNSYDAAYQAGGSDRDFVHTCYQSPVNGRDYCYGMMMGTSMSSPMATGIIALMLEANPLLTANDIRIIFKQTAITDTYTGALPDTGNYIWGLGKINAFQSVKVALDYNGFRSMSSNTDNIIVFPNPASNNIFIDSEFGQNTTLDLQITDITGKLVMKNVLYTTTGYNHQPIDISGLKNGIYILTLSGNGILFNYKVVKD